MSEDSLNIVLTGDRNYLDPLTVVMTSILSNSKNPEKICFYLFLKDVDATDEEYIKKLSKCYPCRINVIHAEQYEELFSSIDVSKFKNTYINIVCYYRILMLKILPDNVKKCFYVDGDMIVGEDLSDVYNSIKQNELLLAVVELFAMGNREDVLSHVYEWQEFSEFKKDPYSRPYFNAGFYLLNVELARQLNLWDEAQKFLKNHPNPPYADQDTLNAIIGQLHHDKIRFLPPSYNVFCALNNDLDGQYPRSYYPQELITRCLRNPIIYHYAGENKPWNTGLCHYNKVWWQYAAESPAASSLLLKLQEMLQDRNRNTGPAVPIIIPHPFDNKNELFHGIRQKMKKRYYDVDPMIQIWFDKYCYENKTNTLGRAFALRKFAKTVQKHKSINDVDFNAIKTLIDSSSTISFDIYDTLVYRAVSSPTDLFEYLEHFNNRQGFKDERVSAELRCRRLHKENEEITIDQIYEEMPERFVDLKNQELKLELELTHRNNAIGDLFNYALSKNKKVIISSDMYLPKNIIEDVLTRNGYKNYFKLYLSSDLMVTKYTGSLFQFILNDLKIAPSEMLHIGDNKTSDYTIPKKLGIHCYQVIKNTDALINSNIRVKLLSEYRYCITTSFLLSTLSTARYDNMGFWKKFGFFYGGPILCSFALWLNDQFKKNDIRDALLIARDGYSIKSALEILSTDTKLHYIYAPRLISNVCNENYIQKLKIDAKEGESTINGLIQSYNTTFKSNITLSDVDDKIAFLESHTKELKLIAEDILDKYKNYLDRLNLNDSIAVVDSVTVNFSAQSLIENSQPGKDILGLYWLSIDNIHNHKLISSMKHNTFQTEHRDIIRDWDVMEFFFSSPEPPIKGIDSEGKPIYKDPGEYDVIRSNVYPEMEEGMLEFVKRWKELVPINSVTRIPAGLVIDYLNILCQTPTSDDKNHLIKIKHAYDSEHTKYVPIFKEWWQN